MLPEDLMKHLRQYDLTHLANLSLDVYYFGDRLHIRSECGRDKTTQKSRKVNVLRCVEEVCDNCILKGVMQHNGLWDFFLVAERFDKALKVPIPEEKDYKALKQLKEIEKFCRQAIDRHLWISYHTDSEFKLAAAKMAEKCEAKLEEVRAKIAQNSKDELRALGAACEIIEDRSGPLKDIDKTSFYHWETLLAAGLSYEKRTKKLAGILGGIRLGGNKAGKTEQFYAEQRTQMSKDMLAFHEAEKVLARKLEAAPRYTMVLYNNQHLAAQLQSPLALETFSVKGTQDMLLVPMEVKTLLIAKRKVNANTFADLPEDKNLCETALGLWETDITSSLHIPKVALNAAKLIHDLI